MFLGLSIGLALGPRTWPRLLTEDHGNVLVAGMLDESEGRPNQTVPISGLVIYLCFNCAMLKHHTWKNENLTCPKLRLVNNKLTKPP